MRIPSLKAIILSLGLLSTYILLPVAGNAQNAAVATAPSITAKASSEKIRFVAASNVVRIKVEILSDSGDALVDVSSKGNIFDWSLQDGSGQSIPDGNYLCLVTVKALSGKISQRIGSVSVAGGVVKLGAKAGSLSPGQQAVIGPVEENASLTVLEQSAETDSATIVGHDGKVGQVTATTGDLTFRTGDVLSGTEKERMRITEDGKIGIGTDKPESTLDVAGTVGASEGIRFGDGTKISAADGKLKVTDKDGNFVPNAAGTGTLNRIAKWTETGGAGTLGNSSIFEDPSNNIGIGTTTPNANAVLHLQKSQAVGTAMFVTNDGPSTALASLRAGLNPANYEVNYASINILGAGWPTGFGGAFLKPKTVLIEASGSNFGIGNLDPAEPILFYTTASRTERMRLTAAGDLGIGTILPNYKLDVVHGGATGIRSKSSTSFSVVDIDADSGDAALRFQKAGAGMWNTRNRPADDNYEIFQLGGGGSRMNIERTTGNIEQPIATGGLVKAAVSVQGGTTPTIARQFNALPSGAAITISRLSVGVYEIVFGDDITGRFYLATPGGPTFGSTTGQISIAQRSGNVNALFVEARDSAGAVSDSVSFNLVIY